MSQFNETLVLSYLGLPGGYKPAPHTEPIEFLEKHIRALPPHLVSHFSLITVPKQRTVIRTVRNRRLKYVNLNPGRIDSDLLRNEWHATRGGVGGPGKEAGGEEREWVRTSFLDGSTVQHVGKLGKLLAEEEEARVLERARSIRRERATIEQSIPEEDDESDESADDVNRIEASEGTEAANDEEVFRRVLKEQFIYGLLEVRVAEKPL